MRYTYTPRPRDIRPSEIYYAEENVTRTLGRDYTIIDFRPPVSGDIFLSVGLNVLTEIASYPQTEPRFILQLLRKGYGVAEVWE